MSYPPQGYPPLPSTQQTGNPYMQSGNIRFEVQKLEYDGCCFPNSIAHVSVSMGTLVLVLNVFTGFVGTLLSAFIDQRGCNF